jgi:hypothetical protein
MDAIEELRGKGGSEVEREIERLAELAEHANTKVKAANNAIQVLISPDADYWDYVTRDGMLTIPHHGRDQKKP